MLHLFSKIYFGVLAASFVFCTQSIFASTEVESWCAPALAAVPSGPVDKSRLLVTEMPSVGTEVERKFVSHRLAQGGIHNQDAFWATVDEWNRENGGDAQEIHFWMLLDRLYVHEGGVQTTLAELIGRRVREKNVLPVLDASGGNLIDVYRHGVAVSNVLMNARMDASTALWQFARGMLGVFVDDDWDEKRTWLVWKPHNHVSQARASALKVFNPSKPLWSENRIGSKDDPTPGLNYHYFFLLEGGRKIHINFVGPEDLYAIPMDLGP